VSLTRDQEIPLLGFSAHWEKRTELFHPEIEHSAVVRQMIEKSSRHP
jgi:hypothetical protein